MLIFKILTPSLITIHHFIIIIYITNKQYFLSKNSYENEVGTQRNAFLEKKTAKNMSVAPLHSHWRMCLKG